MGSSVLSVNGGEHSAIPKPPAKRGDYGKPPLLRGRPSSNSGRFVAVDEPRYDLTIGTSDRGLSIDEVQEKSLKYDHALIMFGGLQGIESALESDEQMQVDDASLLFNQYLNVLPNQGSRTIRTEEAILVTLSGLRSKLKANNEPMVFTEAGIASSSIFPKQKDESSSKMSDNKIDLSRFD